MRSPNNILDTTGSHGSERYFISAREWQEGKSTTYSIPRSHTLVNGKKRWLKTDAMEF
jgi:hypothetical protein